MTRLPNRLKASGLGRVIRRMRRFRGHIESFENGELIGWVAHMGGAPGQHLTVGVYTEQGLVTQAAANMYRADLEQAGIGKGDHGFCIPLNAAMLRSIARQGGQVRLRTLGDAVYNLGRFRLPADALPEIGEGTDDPAQGVEPGRGPRNDLRALMHGDLETIADLATVVTKRPPSSERGPLIPHARLFGAQDYLYPDSPLPAPVSAYAEYVRYRYKVDVPFPIHDDPAEAAHFLNWYMAAYAPLRKGLRVPMSREMVDWLNAPVMIGGQRQALSQVTWSFMMGVPPILHSINFGNPDWVLWAVYWWSVDQSKALHCEDCLVPQSYIDILAETPAPWPDRPWPLTQFMLRMHAQTPALAPIDLDQRSGRRRLTMALVAMSVQRPDYLRYLPQDWVKRLFEADEDGRAPLDKFIADLSQRSDLPPITETVFADMLRLRGFDYHTGRFLTLTDDGHRVEAAMLPPVETEEQADIQLIGPFEKASGLGQATRLSQAILAETPYTVNPVNFGLDNPAPEGFSKTGKLSSWQRARVNLIHLNAETIPLVYAYAPDVFSGAYNIGYFYWELNTPAACHFLGMDLLDEIWVSTEYGVEIFKPGNQGRPVTNVGMCFEDLPEIDRDSARTFVCDRFKFTGDEFVFLVAFDSFSFIQRKNPIGTLKAFAQAFDGVTDVRLVIKTQNRTKVKDPVQQKIWEEVDALLEGDTRIRILDETLTYDDLLRLKKGSDCYVSLHKSEGWGFGMIEAMNLGVPVVATAYSGNMDFCAEDTVWLVEYSEVPLVKDDYIFVRDGQKWAEPDVDDAARQLYAVYSDAETRAARIQAAHAFVQAEFSAKAIARRYDTRLQEIFKEL